MKISFHKVADPYLIANTPKPEPGLMKVCTAALLLGFFLGVIATLGVVYS